MGEAYISTEEDNDLGKTVEYGAMIHSGFRPGEGLAGMPSCFADYVCIRKINI